MNSHRSFVMSHLREKTAKAISWNAFSAFMNQGLQVAVAIILTNLLEPSDFGLIAMISIISGITFLLNDFGFSEALIQSQKIDEFHKSSVFWMNILIAVFLSLVFIWGAGPLSKFYNEPRIIPLMYVLSLNFGMQASYLVQYAMMRKEIRFKELSFIQIRTSVVSGIVTLIAAFSGFGVWALVIQQLSIGFLHGVQIWWIYGWRPKFNFQLEKIRDLFGFSLNMSIFNLLQYGFQKLDILLVGRYFGTAALGFYNRSLKFQLIPFTAIKKQVGTVMFPTLTKLQSNKTKQRDVYLKLTAAITMILFPIMIGIYLISEEFVLGVLGEKWSILIPLIQILSLASCFEAIGFPFKLFMANDETKKQVRITILTQSIRVILVLIGIYLNSLNHLILCIGISMVINSILLNYFSSKIIGLSLLQIIQTIIPFLSIAITILPIVIIFVNNFVSSESYLILLFVKTVVYAVLYVGSMLVLKPKPVPFILVTLQTMVHKKYNTFVHRNK